MRFCLFFIAFTFSTCLLAQIDSNSKIKSIDVIYKEESTLGSDSLPKVLIQSTILIKDSSDIAFINFEIIDKTDNSSKYKVSYNANNAPVMSQDGQLLFKKEHNTIFLNLPFVLLLKPYLYQIVTKDSNGIESEVFSDFK
jgi:hypothetical protein